MCLCVRECPAVGCRLEARHFINRNTILIKVTNYANTHFISTNNFKIKLHLLQPYLTHVVLAVIYVDGTVLSRIPHHTLTSVMCEVVHAASSISTRIVFLGTERDLGLAIFACNKHISVTCNEDRRFSGQVVACDNIGRAC